MRHAFRPSAVSQFIGTCSVILLAVSIGFFLYAWSEANGYRGQPYLYLAYGGSAFGVGLACLIGYKTVDLLERILHELEERFKYE